VAPQKKDRRRSCLGWSRPEDGSQAQCAEAVQAEAGLALVDLIIFVAGALLGFLLGVMLMACLNMLPRDDDR
jgi:hypothetical protein